MKKGLLLFADGLFTLTAITAQEMCIRDRTKVGNLTPDLVWGITNTFRYKNFTLNFTIDVRIGGMS